MEKQIPRSIQYSDLKPEVIENQIKLVRFTPQTNIQNQVPNDIVRFQLVGNGFYDPYSSYISMVVDFGAANEQFTCGKSAECANRGVMQLQKYWDNAKKYLSDSLFNDYQFVSGAIGTKFTEDYSIGCNLSAMELNHQNMIVSEERDGLYNFHGLGIFNGTDGDDFVANLSYSLGVQGVGDARNFMNMPNGQIQYPVFEQNWFYTAFGQVGTSILGDYPNQNFNNFLATDAPPRVLNQSKKFQQSDIAIPGCEFKMLDRSAHSFINRLVIRSQGTEIERIEQYDVVAGMLNDLIYSNEQAQFHTFEGFGGAPYIQKTKISSSLDLHRSTIANSIGGPRGRVGERIWGWSFVGIDEDNFADSCQVDLSFDLTQSSQNGTNLFQSMEFQAHISRTVSIPFKIYQQFQNGYDSQQNIGITQDMDLENIKVIQPGGFFMRDYVRNPPSIPSDSVVYVDSIHERPYAHQRGAQSIYYKMFQGNYSHPIAKFVDKYVANKRSIKTLEYAYIHSLTDINVGFFRSGNYRMIPLGAQQYEFIIPIYSGLIGVLMPEKKLLPLSLLPLEVDFTLSPHALMCGYTNGYGGSLNRNYTMKKMEIYSHLVFFEQEIHRSMESIVAEHGLFLHINTFYMAPVTLHGTNAVTQNISINLHFKNINSIHVVNLYTKYLTSMSARKLHFVSHNLKSIQIRNGSELIPSEPLNMDNNSVNQWEKSSIQGGRYNKIFLELLKTYNKMHDPTCDTALDCGLSYHIDKYAEISSSIAQDFDVNNSNQFSGNARERDNICKRIHDLSARVYGVEGFLIGKYHIEPQIQNVQSDHIVSGLGQVMTNDQFKSVNRIITLSRGIDNKGSWGTNPNHIAKRPNMFYTPTPGIIQPNQRQEGMFFGLSSRLLAEKIQRFSALTGRCQYAISLEGINLGTDNSLLCGKRGLIPFDVLVSGNKSDNQQSMSLVFAKCDFIVYIRPDLVVTVLGK